MNADGLRRRAHATIDGLRRLLGGFGTSALALATLFWIAIVAILCLVGIGLLLFPYARSAVRAVADRERARLSRWGPEVLGPLSERPSGRELLWLVEHATAGFFISAFGLIVPLSSVQDIVYPFYWWLVPPDSVPGLVFWPVHNQRDAILVGLYGLAWVLLGLYLAPKLARLQAWPGRRLLSPPPGTDLSLRVAELTATRAAALDAHAAELRRIERSLHDGAQNRLVAVSVLLGAARRAVARDPAAAGEMLDRAQDAAELALAELRTVVRGILPPVLDGRGLDGALAGLAGDSGVPCRLEVDLPRRCAASVEATAYFVVAEALTNINKHSGATTASVRATVAGDRLILTVSDDGRGGADEDGGSGLTGIRRRVEAYDGTLTLTSPAGGPTTMRVELPCGS
ncbi:sensor domain-containing protein [Actinoplanes sp. LDG1-06]|uniref:histidine kinase n=1 Tax=Paractinoplanes ovalisporus TaxID=2810368 RepID=A0ABS2AGS9_9ACTN|nr:sensor domain-containing protein [Actinoplanes ovalisporus]MBM2619032.1 sensor domain-containing protein [Actinoplanes ovalisporus]